MTRQTIIKPLILSLSTMGILACQFNLPHSALKTPAPGSPVVSKNKRMYAFQTQKSQEDVFQQYFPNPLKGMKWSYRIKNWDTRISQFKRYSEEVITLDILDVSSGNVKAILRGWDDQEFQVKRENFWKEILYRLSWEYFDGPFQTKLYCPTNFWCEKSVSVPSGTFNARPILSSNLSNPETWTPHAPLNKAGEVMIQMDINPTIGLVKFKERSRGNNEWVWMLELINYSTPYTISRF